MTCRFLITGMFRSGTTLVARMLDAHPHLICASDPYAPVFKAYRNRFGERRIEGFDGNAPLHDYYFEPVHNGLFAEMQASGFDVPLGAGGISALIPAIESQSAAYAPRLLDQLSTLDGTTFSDVVHNGLQAVGRAYHKPHARGVGFKEVWVGEFGPHFLALADNARVVHIVRDPRAVAASNYASGMRYPLLFLARQWRKLASVAWLGARNSGRVRIVRFEDLTTSPQATASALCNFLGVDFDPAMLAAENFRDGAGDRWRRNSSYRDVAVPADGAGAIDRTAVTQWQSVLPPSHRALLERTCGFEMRLFGYDCPPGGAEVRDWADDLLFEDDPHCLSAWIRPYSSYYYLREMTAEHFRHECLHHGVRPGDALERLMALDPAMYAELLEHR